MTTTTTKTTTKTRFSTLKLGDNLSESQYYKVLKISGNKVQLRNGNGEDIVVDSDYIEKCLISSDYFTSEQTINKTEASNILLKNPCVALAVSFNKQVKITDVLSEMMKAYKGSTFDTMAESLKKTLTSAFEGEERTIRGYHSGELNELGRLNFVDMDIEKDTTKSYDNRFRQIDPRTINWLIVNNVKYNVK